MFPTTLHYIDYHHDEGSTETEVYRLLSEWRYLLYIKKEEYHHDEDMSVEDLKIVNIVRNRLLKYFNRTKVPCVTDQCEIGIDGVYYSLCNKKEIEEVLLKNEGKEAVVKVVAGFNFTGKVEIFEGEQCGMIVRANGNQGSLFDKVWKPDNFDKTLSQMYNYKFLVSPRHNVYLPLIDKMRTTSFSGLFEIHITVKYSTGLDQNHFKQICQNNEVKPVLIELPVGQNPTQMMTASFHNGRLVEAHKKAFLLSHVFIKAGYDIQRTKIEAMCSTSGVPLTDEDANLKMSKANYFEFHLKLELTTQQLPSLEKICKSHNAHLSKNAFKTNNDGNQERFVTLRMYGVGKDTALKKLGACELELQQSGFNITTKQREFSVYDSNVQLDKGWINV